MITEELNIKKNPAATSFSQLRNMKERNSHSNLKDEPKKDPVINDCNIHPNYSTRTLLRNPMKLRLNYLVRV